MGSAQLVYEISRMALCESDGNVIVIKVAMDESGVHDGSPVLTVGAYVARPGLWRDWTKRWNVAKRPIKMFHAVDCANFAGEFKGWTAERRDPLVVRLLDVLRESDFPGCVIGLHMDEFRKAMAGRGDLLSTFGEPYVACFHWVVQTIINVAVEVGSQERIGFVHECNDYRQEALEAFAWIKRYGNPGHRVVGLTFAETRDYVPLQAADVLAYEGNKRLRDPSRPERRPWQALNPDGRIIAMHYGRNNMGELIDRLEKIRDGRFSEIDFGSGWNRAHFHPDRVA
jgi:hypothetical protein